MLEIHMRTYLTSTRAKIILLFIVVFAFVIRLHTIRIFTEFLGDQGRAGMVAYETIKTGQIPLAGPTTLLNQHLGPFFYYLAIVIFGVGDMNPLIPALFMVIVGVATVVLVYAIGKILFSSEVGILFSFLWAISPHFVVQERIFWEPNLVPFFSLLFLYGWLVLNISRKKNGWILIWTSLAVLFQLHYFCLFFLPLLFLIIVQHFWFNMEKKFYRWFFFGFVLFLIILFPFIIYLHETRWRDLVEILQLISGQGSTPSKRSILSNSLDYLGRIIKFFVVLPVLSTRTVSVYFLVISSVLTFFDRKNSVWMFIGLLWVVTGAICMGLYAGVVYDHYLLFLIPGIILLLGKMISIHKLVGVTIIIINLFFVFPQFQAVQKKTYDIDRLEEVSKFVQGEINGDSFSQTLVESRSFSDLHYQFAFRNIPGRVPIFSQPKKIFIVCDTIHCTDVLPRTIPILCYEHHCSGDYGNIEIVSREKLTATRLRYSTVYVLDGGFIVQNPKIY